MSYFLVGARKVQTIISLPTRWRLGARKHGKKNSMPNHDPLKSSTNTNKSSSKANCDSFDEEVFEGPPKYLKKKEKAFSGPSCS